MILKKNKKSESVKAKRSEEISDIINRMPMTFGRWVSLAVVIFSSFCLLFGWIIKYPDVVTGEIKINSNNTPVKLVVNAPGNIHLFSFRAQDLVKEGDYIAVVENPASTKDVRNILLLLHEFDPNRESLIELENVFPNKVSLGELNLKYYAFLSSLKNRCDYEKDNIFEKQRQSLEDDIKWKEIILKEADEMSAIIQQRLHISQKWYDKYVSLNKNIITTYEYEVDRSKNEYLLMKQEVQNLKKENASIQMQITENKNRLNQLCVEQKEKERILYLDILTSFQDLIDNIKAWEQKYVFKAPFTGKLEYLKFISENQYVNSGEIIFGIIPEKSDILGQVLLPSNGAGKVRVGSAVTIKLDNYPYMEYGSIEGVVSSISLISQSQKIEQQFVDTYLIIVDLPVGLKTNYGEVLDFRFEIGGVADIIVQKRRLIERLFDNLKYITK